MVPVVRRDEFQHSDRSGRGVVPGIDNDRCGALDAEAREHHLDPALDAGLEQGHQAAATVQETADCLLSGFRQAAARRQDQQHIRAFGYRSECSADDAPQRVALGVQRRREAGVADIVGAREIALALAPQRGDAAPGDRAQPIERFVQRPFGGSFHGLETILHREYHRVRSAHAVAIDILRVIIQHPVLHPQRAGLGDAFEKQSSAPNARGRRGRSRAWPSFSRAWIEVPSALRARARRRLRRSNRIALRIVPPTVLR